MDRRNHPRNAGVAEVGDPAHLGLAQPGIGHHAADDGVGNAARLVVGAVPPGARPDFENLRNAVFSLGCLFPLLGYRRSWGLLGITPILSNSAANCCELADIDDLRRGSLRAQYRRQTQLPLRGRWRAHGPYWLLPGWTEIRASPEAAPLLDAIEQTRAQIGISGFAGWCAWSRSADARLDANKPAAATRRSRDRDRGRAADRRWCADIGDRRPSLGGPIAPCECGGEARDRAGSGASQRLQPARSRAGRGGQLPVAGGAAHDRHRRGQDRGLERLVARTRRPHRRWNPRRRSGARSPPRSTCHRTRVRCPHPVPRPRRHRRAGRKTEVQGRQGKQPDGSAKTREAKLAVVWSNPDNDGRPVRDPGSATYNAAETIATRDARALRPAHHPRGRTPRLRQRRAPGSWATAAVDLELRRRALRCHPDRRHLPRQGPSVRGCQGHLPARARSANDGPGSGART